MSIEHIKFRGYVYRTHYYKTNPLDTAASKNSGGRWNRKGLCGALYTCLEEKALRAELKKMFEIRGFTTGDIFIRSVTKIKVKLEKVLDLTNPDTRKAYGIDLSEITSDENDAKEKCLKVADEARKKGCEAILSPSGPDPDGINLNIYPDKKLPRSYIRPVETKPIIRF